MSKDTRGGVKPVQQKSKVELLFIPCGFPNRALRPVENGQAIGDATRLRDNLTTKVGHEAALGGQLTLKDDSDAKITKGPKMKEKKLKSDKPDPSEENQDLNKTKIIFQP